MLELVLLAVVLYAICSAVFGSAGRKDEKRRPCFILEERNYLSHAKKTSSVKLASNYRKLAKVMRKFREKAGKNERLAKLLDEMEAEQAYYQRKAQQRTADMEQKMADMQRKSNDLEREARYRY